MLWIMFMYFKCLILSLIITFILQLLTLFVNMKNQMKYSNRSPFECGFMGFEESRNPFSLQFFLVSLIFLVFDVELMILFPVFTLYVELYTFNMFILLMFVLFLMMGLFWEWMKNMLEWMY